MIRREFLLAFIAIALLLIFNAIISTLFFNDTSGRLEEIVDEYTPSMFALQDMAYNATRMHDEALSTIFLLQLGAHDQAEHEALEFEEAYAHFQSAFHTYTPSEGVSSAPEEQLLVMGDQIYNACQDLMDYVRVSGEDLNSTTVITLKEDLETLEDDFADTYSTMMQSEMFFLSNARDHAEEGERITFVVAGGFSLLALIGALGLGVFLSNRIVSPVKRLEIAAFNATRGRYDTEVYVAGENELATLAQGFNGMMRAIKLRDDELRQLNQSLEARIDERTRELALKAEEAQVANRLKDEFLAAMSHELRTPLNAIIGYIGIMEMMGDLNDENLERISTMEVSANHLLELINDVLDLSRVEAGQFKPDYQPVDIETTTKNIVRKFESAAQKKGVELDIKIAPDAPKVLFTDEFAFNKILSHLLDNAVKFTENGQIGVSVDDAQDHILVRVSDTGIGIPADQQAIIFELFRQGDGSSTRLYGGTGLGLSIVRSLCTALNGRIEVESKFHIGSTFTVKLPYQQNIVAFTRD